MRERKMEGSMHVVSSFTPYPVRERFSKVLHTEVRMPPEKNVLVNGG